MSFERITERIWQRRVPFLVAFFVVTVITYAVLFAIDFIPEPVSPESDTEAIPTDEPIAETTAEVAAASADSSVPDIVTADPLPHKIIFDSLNRTVEVSNPQSREITDLDAALLEGAVRHPDSADFSDPGNIFILGHSSYLPNVFNKNFQAFNGIQELDWGDTIRLQSGDMEYTYFVEEVYEAKTAEVVVPETPGKANLTLATCNSFGSKDDRFIVEAKLISERVL